MPTAEQPRQTDLNAEARRLPRAESGSECVELAVVTLVVTLGWLVAGHWLQAALAECVSTVTASLRSLTA